MSPLYEYQCQECNKIHERTFRIVDFPENIPCVECGGRANKIISLGAIQTDGDVKWLPSAVKVLQPDHERPIATRGEYKRYLKDKGIQPIG